ncbi:MAG: signal peptide peptidase SppA [Actinobacillus minor]|nr:signal peptide peptidase SppA [Actinobacillus minor]
MLKIFKAFYQIFRCVRETVMSLFFILFIFVAAAIVGLVNTFNAKQPSDALVHFDKGALILDLNGYLADNREEYADFYRLIESEMGNEQPKKYSTFDIVDALKNAQTDPRITGLVLELDKFEGGDYPSLTYLGKGITAFKTSGKPVIAIGSSYGQSQYYLASFADQIYLNRAGAVELQGLNYSNLYFKSLFDKIEAKPYIFRVGTYKSAVEPLIRDEMSEEAKQNAKGWLEPMWKNLQQGIADNRQIDVGKILPEIDRLLALRKQHKGNEATFALQQGLINEVKTRAEMRQLLVEKFGADEENDFKSIRYDDYATDLPDRFNRKAPNKIAVINIEGEITMGESLEDTAGADTLIRQLQRVRQDKTVRGLILRINSPGGSALASELIRQEVEAIQQAGIPVVSSMGGMAASGGYWIAATSDAIVADPNTLTGSIGIFGVLFNFEKTAQNLGVREDGISTSPLAEISGLKPLSSHQSELIQMSVEQGYREFLDLVSHGRKMDLAKVDQIAQGQVWLGQKAQSLGLVDQLGNFDDTLALLGNLINRKLKEQNKPEIETFTPQWFTEQDESLFGEISRSLNAKAKLNLASWLNLPLVQRTQQTADFFTKFNDPKNQYLYCFTCGTVR